MKVLFMGTPDFAVGTLEALLEAGHDVVGVITQQDRPQGRKMELKPTAVKAAASVAGTQTAEKKTTQAPSTSSESAATTSNTSSSTVKTASLKKSLSVQKENEVTSTADSENTENGAEPAETAPEKATDSNL